MWAIRLETLNDKGHGDGDNERRKTEETFKAKLPIRGVNGYQQTKKDIKGVSSFWRGGLNRQWYQWLG